MEYYLAVKEYLMMWWCDYHIVRMSDKKSIYGIIPSWKCVMRERYKDWKSQYAKMLMIVII